MSGTHFNHGKTLNHHRRKITAATLLLALVLAATAVASTLVNGQNPQQTTDSSDDAYSIRVGQLLKEVSGEISQIRNATLPDVKFEIVTKAWVIANWGKTIIMAGGNPATQDKVYRGLFITSQSESLYRAQVEWAGGFVAAELGGKIYVVRENFNPFNDETAKSTLAHELTHILQNTLPKVPRGSRTFDGEKARLALIEGDASFTSEFFKNETFTRVSRSGEIQNERFYPVLLGSPLLNIHFSLPASVSPLNYFPYKYGQEFVRALYNKGGWALVKAAYLNPPNTTEQILHPEKYFEGEGAVKVVAPNVTDSSWTRKSTDTYGEYFIDVMLAKWLPQSEADRAAAGWSGDSAVSFQRGNDSIFAWNVTWDSALDAAQFDAAFHKMTKAAGAVELKGVWCFEANGRFISVKTEGQSTVVIMSTVEDLNGK